jgi:hypothetical protein
MMVVPSCTISKFKFLRMIFLGKGSKKHFLSPGFQVLEVIISLMLRIRCSLGFHSFTSEKAGSLSKTRDLLKIAEVICFIATISIEI